VKHLLAVVATLLALPAPSDACSQRHFSMFEKFELATFVAHVRVGGVPPRGGKVQLAVKRMIKGDAKKKSLTTFESSTSCAVGYKRNKTAIVFLYDDGDTVGHGQGYITDVKTWEATVDAWAAATSDVTRRSILVEVLVKNDETLAYDAASYLADSPGLLNKVDADQRQQLAAVTPSSKYSLLPLVLARLAGGKFEKVSDATKLATIIDAGKGESDPDRIAALERCERVHGTRLYPYTSYNHGVADHFWKALAEACRTGKPAS